MNILGGKIGKKECRKGRRNERIRKRRKNRTRKGRRKFNFRWCSRWKREQLCIMWLCACHCPKRQRDREKKTRWRLQGHVRTIEPLPTTGPGGGGEKGEGWPWCRQPPDSGLKARSCLGVLRSGRNTALAWCALSCYEAQLFGNGFQEKQIEKHGSVSRRPCYDNTLQIISFGKIIYKYGFVFLVSCYYSCLIDSVM